MHVADGIKFIQERDTTCISNGANGKTSNERAQSSDANVKQDTEFKILIVDADSSDIRYHPLLINIILFAINFFFCSSGWTCPPAEFLDESFLISVKNFLSGGGLFVINLVSRSKSIREMVIARMKKVFF